MSNDLAQELVDTGFGINAGFALITIHLTHNRVSVSVLAKVSSIFTAHQISFTDVIVGRNEIFVVVADLDLPKVLSLLYEATRSWENAHGRA